MYLDHELVEVHSTLRPIDLACLVEHVHKHRLSSADGPVNVDARCPSAVVQLVCAETARGNACLVAHEKRPREEAGAASERRTAA
eukprot:scaffold133984_cov29-Tisochrysis_lutea.AAC.2